MKRLIAMIAAVCLMLPLFGCGDDGSGKGFRFPLDGEPVQLDPQISSDAASITVLSVLFEGLTRLDADGKAIPGAADWTVSSDGRTYTFTLREAYWSTLSDKSEDNRWKEPTPVTADDFVYGLQRLASPATGSALADELDGIVNARAVRSGQRTVDALGVHATDDMHLTITLEAPDAGFPERLAATPYLPCNRAFFAYASGRYGLEKQYLITNGPFVLTAWEHGKSLLLHRNETYRDTRNVLPEAVRFVIDGDRTLDALQNGDMDVIPLLSSEVNEAEDAGISVVGLQDTVRSLWFNTSDEWLSSGTVRRALRDALEWSSIYDYLEKNGEPAATGYIAPDGTVKGKEIYRDEQNSSRFRTDVARAQDQWEEALNGTAPPRFTMVAASDDISANVARYLVQSWQKNLKLHCALQLVSEEELGASVQTGNYQIALYTVTATGLTGAENLWSYATGAAGNLSRFSDGGMDGACRAALKGGRQELQALETLLRQQCPSVPISFPRRYYGIAADTEGITVRPFNGGNFGSPFEFISAKKWKD